MKIDPITFNKLTPGCLVLAYVLKVDSDRLIVSLPGSSTGVVLHHEISDVLHKMQMNKQSNGQQVLRRSTCNYWYLWGFHRVCYDCIVG